VLYYSLHRRILQLPDDVLVYPAHGPGSLCGKNLGPELFTTIGKEKSANPLLQLSCKKDFVDQLLKDQPYVPKYFSYDVQQNRKGALCPVASINNLSHLPANYAFSPDDLIIDVRPKELFKAGHHKGAFNIPLIKTFETWLGSIIDPNEKFYIVGSATEAACYRAASIGYEVNVKGISETAEGDAKSATLDLEDFTNHRGNYTIVDVRNDSEVAAVKIFPEAIHIPLPNLRERVGDIVTTKPIVVHCAGGTRSAIAASLLEKYLPTKIFDLGEVINRFVY